MNTTVTPEVTSARVAPGGYRVAWLMMAMMAVSWLDRALPGILIEPMRADLHLSDTQVSLLTGLSFALCYSIASYPIGWLADRTDRFRLLGISLVLWCSMTVAFGLVHAFALMFLFRMGVGLGEAVVVPAGLSLLADYFPREQLPRASGILQIGSSVGITLALIGGSALTQWLATSGVSAHPGIAAWRLTFMSAGGVGLLLAPVLLLSRDARRIGIRAAEAGPSTATLWAHVIAVRGFALPFLLGVALFNLYVAGYLGWLAPYFQRTYGWSLAKTGAMSGLAVVGTGVAGALGAGWLTALVNRRTTRDRSMAVIVLASVLIAPLAILGPLASDGNVAFASVVLQLLFTFGAGAIVPVAMINAAPEHLRARFTALVVFLGGIIGSALGPSAFALITDDLLGGPAMLRWSLMLGSAAIFVVLIPLWVLAWRAYPAAVVAARVADTFMNPSREGPTHADL